MKKSYNVYSKLEELKASPYYEVLTKYFEEDENYSMDDFLSIIEAIRDCYDNSEESVDSDYIHNDYELTIENIKFCVTGSSYRKDHSVCDEQMGESISVTDLELEKKEKAEKKAKEKGASESKWKELFDSKSKEELFEIIKNLPYPKKI